MKLLQADLSASYPMARAGGHRTVHSLLKHLASDPGTECLALVARRGLGATLTTYDPRLADFDALGVRGVVVGRDRWVFDCGYPIWAVDRVEDVFAEAIDTFQPDVVWSNSFLSLPILLRARRLGLAAVWYIHDGRTDAVHLREAIGAGVAMAAVSRFLADKVRQQSGCECETIYPLINEDDYVVERDEGGYVTLINPRPVKGFDTFLELVPLLPEVEFLVVESWPLGDGLAEVRGRLDQMGNCAIPSATAGRACDLPADPVAAGPLGRGGSAVRVVREAQLSGIPVLGSRRGGIPEMLGDPAVVIDDYENPHAWAGTIRAVLGDQSRYTALSDLAARSARREELTTGQIVRRFAELCRRAAGAARAAEAACSKRK